MSETLRGILPSIYGPLLPELFDRPAIQETRATCSDCAMCDKGTTPPGVETAFFKPDHKCCTYHPTLPNYLVGAVLADESAELGEGRKRLHEKIAARIGVTPQWLAPPRKWSVLLEASRASSFGRSKVLLCPFYEQGSGLCTIWRHRETICSTFFCKHVGGARGEEFWTALKLYLGFAERKLTEYAARSVCPEVTEPDLPRLKLSLEDLEDRPPKDAEYARSWAAWRGRESAFYVACHEKVRALDAADYLRLVHDDGGQPWFDALVAAHQALTAPRLASNLVLNPKLRVLGTTGGVTLSTYSHFDALCLTEPLYDALKLLQAGEPVAAGLARLKAEHGLELSEELLLELQMHDVVVPPPAE